MIKLSRRITFHIPPSGSRRSSICRRLVLSTGGSRNKIICRRRLLKRGINSRSTCIVSRIVRIGSYSLSTKMCCTSIKLSSGVTRPKLVSYKLTNKSMHTSRNKMKCYSLICDLVGSLIDIASDFSWSSISRSLVDSIINDLLHDSLECSHSSFHTFLFRQAAHGGIVGKISITTIPRSGLKLARIHITQIFHYDSSSHVSPHSN